MEKIRVTVKGLDHVTSSTLQDGEHECGDFEASANTSDVVGDIRVREDGCSRTGRGSEL